MSANAADEEKKLSKMAEEREDDKGSVKSATAGSVAPDDGTSKADSTGTGTDKKLTLKEPSDAKNQTKNTDEKSGDEKSKTDSKLATDGGNGQPEDDADSRDNGNADKPKATAEGEAKGKNRNGAKKLTDEEEADVDDAEKPSGKSLGSIALIDANITKAKVDDLQTLHTIMYDGPAKPMVLRRNLRKFDGFEVAAGSDAYRKRVSATEKLDVKKLAQLAEILALDKKGSKEELAGRICSFLLKPDGDEELPEEMGEEEEEEEDEEEENEDEEVSEEEAPKKKTPVKRGAPAAGGGRGRGENASSKSSSGRPKRSTAGRGYQDNSLYVDYTTSEEEEEETVKVGRGRRARRGSDSGSDYNPSAGSDSDAGKRRSARAPARGSRTSARNVRKRYSDDESEESASDDDFSEEDQRKKKTTPARGNRGRPSTTARQSPRARGRKRKADTESEEEESEEEEEVDSEDSERPKRKSMATVRGGGRSAAVTNNKAKNSTPAKGRGQPKRAAAVTSAKKSKRGRDRSSSGEEDEEEEEEEDEEEPELDDNESEDEKPLVKKAKQEKETDTAAPPSEDDIKEYLKEILDEANLEEITMKTVCKKVYAKYPQHDLSHKKDFIKATVKSLIST